MVQVPRLVDVTKFAVEEVGTVRGVLDLIDSGQVLAWRFNAKLLVRESDLPRIRERLTRSEQRP